MNITTYFLIPLVLFVILLYPLVNREDYMERYMNSVVNNFFSGSVKVVVSFLFKTCHF